MTILALTEVVMVDIKGTSFRLTSEREQGIPVDRIHRMDTYKDEYEDLGLVIWRGVEYYATLYRATMPTIDDDFLEISG